MFTVYLLSVALCGASALLGAYLAIRSHSPVSPARVEVSEPAQRRAA